MEERSPGIMSGFEYKECMKVVIASLVPARVNSPREKNGGMSVGGPLSRASVVVSPHENFIRSALHYVKLCVPETFLGSDSISYTLASQVDMPGKLHYERPVVKIACGECCLGT